MNPLRRPDRVETREMFATYVSAMIQSLDEALANPSIPYGPAVDDAGIEWESTTLSMFADGMNAWADSNGWGPHDRGYSAVLDTLSIGESLEGDEVALRRYLSDIAAWTGSDAVDPDDFGWQPAAMLLKAGQTYE